MLAAVRSMILVLALVLSLAPSSRAGTATSTLSVRVVVAPACTVAGATLDFGSYTSGQPGDLNGFTQLTYSDCPAGQLRFTLDGGGTGTTTARKMSNGSGGLLNYGVFRDSGRTQNFGLGAEARLITLTAPGWANVSVYGGIPGGQSVAAGTYTDTLIVTLDF